MSNRHALEMRLTFIRVAQLHSQPINGNFDAIHLKKINEFIFQDLPSHGFFGVTPGIFRAETPNNLDWIKQRKLETVASVSNVAYSSMNENAVNELNAILDNTSPTILAKLSIKDFTHEIARLYANVDYIHPFQDGNSRTLRIFFYQLAKQAGFILDWNQFNKMPQGRDRLYIARDLSVNAIAFNRVQDNLTKRLILETQHIFGRNKNLSSILPEIIEYEKKSEG